MSSYVIDVVYFTGIFLHVQDESRTNFFSDFRSHRRGMPLPAVHLYLLRGHFGDSRKNGRFPVRFGRTEFLVILTDPGEIFLENRMPSM